MTDNISSPLARRHPNNNKKLKAAHTSSKLQTIQKHRKHQTTFPLNQNSDLAILSARFDLQVVFTRRQSQQAPSSHQVEEIIKNRLKVRSRISLISHIRHLNAVRACQPACLHMHARVHGPHAEQVERLQAPTNIHSASAKLVCVIHTSRFKNLSLCF